MDKNKLKVIAKHYCRAALYGSTETVFADENNLLTPEEHEFLAQQIEKIADRIISEGNIETSLEVIIKRIYKTN